MIVKSVYTEFFVVICFVLLPLEEMAAQNPAGLHKFNIVIESLYVYPHSAVYDLLSDTTMHGEFLMTEEYIKLNGSESDCACHQNIKGSWTYAKKYENSDTLLFYKTERYSCELVKYETSALALRKSDKIIEIHLFHSNEERPWLYDTCVTTYTYDSNGRIILIEETCEYPNSITSYSYTYDSVGLIHSSIYRGVG